MSNSEIRVSAISHCIAITLCILALYSLYYAMCRRHKHLPPGPKGTLLFGNALQFPKLDQHLKMAEWACQYGRLRRYTGSEHSMIVTTGDIVYVEFFGQPTVVINTFEAATKLMERGSAKYSDKPRLVYLNELYVQSCAWRYV